ncbi:hypothetical protein AD998_21925, partial [bacterium 336/3]
MKTTWTAEQIEVLKEKYPNTQTRALAAELGHSYHSVKNKALQLGIAKAKDYKIERLDSELIEHRKSIIEKLYSSTSNKEIAELLNVKPCVVKNIAYDLGLRKVDYQPTTFKKGNIPKNKGLKQVDYMTPEAIEKTKATRFKKGNEPHNTNYNGHERISKDGYVEVRITKGKYVLKHRLVWQQANGPIPKNHIIVFKDGD